MGLALAPNVSFCLVTEHAVFMDVARYRYFALPATRLAEGDALEALIGQGLLSGRGPWHAGIEPAHAPLATQVLEGEGGAPPSARLALACMRACGHARELPSFCVSFRWRESFVAFRSANGISHQLRCGMPVTRPGSSVPSAR